jgi:hypothetical protein
VSEGFIDVLQAVGPAADRAHKMDLYGRFIGSWEVRVTRFPEDGATRERPGEWHFGWVLEGRAIQDVWIVPSRGALRERTPVDELYYGTTLRTYDPRIDAWHIQYTDPASQTYSSMIGRGEGKDIVQIGTNANGQSIRWSFRDISRQYFLWRGEVSADQGQSWRKQVEFMAIPMKSISMGLSPARAFG